MFLWDLIHAKEKALTSNLNNFERLSTLGKGGYNATNTASLSEFATKMDLDPSEYTIFSADNSEHIKVETPKIISSWELQNPDLEARFLLINLIFAAMTNDAKYLSGISLRNIKNSPIEIDQINLEWEDAPANADVEEVEIDGDTVWTGSEGSPASLDINNVTIEAQDTIPINYIRFDEEMAGGYLYMEIIMSDGSRVDSELELFEQEGEGGTAPPPCSEWCIVNGYEYGVCRASSFWCWIYGQEHESEADPLCTGGSSADTCCCED
jgi:hypothetical protein